MPRRMSRRMAVSTMLLRALLLAGLPAALSAQEIRALVVLPDSATPVRGVIVTATDARGAELARAVSDASGNARLTLARGGVVVVRALRVGYRPTALPPVTVAAAGTVDVRLVLGVESVSLAAITVRRSDVCRARENGGDRVAQVWEEARKALLVARTGGGGDPLVAEWTQYDRQFDSTGQRLLDQAIQRTRAPSERPFRSQDAAILARDGYAVEESGEVIYYAPDADVLLSDTFAATHCFQLTDAPPGQPGLIGLRFRPVEAARDRRDIEGTFWLDRASAELRSIDFTFTNLPAVAERVEPGGRVEFTRLPQGVWLVSRWWIRMPELERVRPGTVAGRRVSVVGSPIRLRGAKTVGGEITRVERDGETLFAAVGSALAVRVLPWAGDAPATAVGATVRVEGTDYEAVTDSSGLARFPLVLPGRYRVSVVTPPMAAARERPLQQEVTIAGDSVHALQQRLPFRGPRQDAVGLGLVAAPRLRSEVVFTVSDSAGRAIAGAELVAIDAARTTHRLRSDSTGRARLEELPAGEMRVEARFPGYHLATGIVTVEQGVTPAQVLLERIDGTQLGAVRVEAEADERARYSAFEQRRRAGVPTASITRADIERRGVVNAWQMLRNVSAIELIEGPEGVIPVSRRVQSMDLRSGLPCYMRLAIDGVLIPDTPVNLAHRLPAVGEIHGIEVFGGPARIPSEYAGDQRNMVCGLIVVWTR